MSIYKTDPITPAMYDEATGVGFDPDGDFSLRVEIDRNSVVIVGSRDGLRSLAQMLVDLAEPGVPSGHHVHLSASVCLDEGSSEIAVVRA